MRLKALPLDGEAKYVEIDRIPDRCPVCHTSVRPKECYPGRASPANANTVQIVYQCTKTDCEALFIGIYTYRSLGPQNVSSYQLSEVLPSRPEIPEFPPEVASLSSSFVEIFTQAMAAESAGLDQLVGIGLRKALEFLLKDFVVSQEPSNEDKIRRMPLAHCIKEYVKDPNVKKCAEKAVWLANDETHYTRRWENKDISDLKILTRLTVNWIESVILTDKYESEMNAST